MNPRRIDEETIKEEESERERVFNHTRRDAGRRCDGMANGGSPKSHPALKIQRKKKEVGEKKKQKT